MEISKVEIIDGECYVGMNMLENEIKKNKILEKALIDIRKYMLKNLDLGIAPELDYYAIRQNILQIIDKVLGGNQC